MTGFVLDAGALIALERRDKRVLALLARLVTDRVAVHVPAGVLAQVWRGSARQHAIRRLLRTGAVRVDPLTEDAATAVGVLLAKSRTVDVTDGHVMLLARALQATVVTSDPDDLKRIDTRPRLVVV